VTIQLFGLKAGTTITDHDAIDALAINIDHPFPAFVLRHSATPRNNDNGDLKRLHFAAWG